VTRMHFLFIADIIRTLDVGQEERNKVAIAFARALRNTNTQFDKARFIKACGADDKCLLVL